MRIQGAVRDRKRKEVVRPVMKPVNKKEKLFLLFTARGTKTPVNTKLSRHIRDRSTDLFLVFINFRIPCCRIDSGFPIILMPYFFRYRRSSCRSLLHGNSLQVRQNRSLTSLHAKMVQFLLHFRSGELHPVHRFFSRRNAKAESTIHAAQRNKI
mgnify:CR=1 FL=1